MKTRPSHRIRLRRTQSVLVFTAKRTRCAARFLERWTSLIGAKRAHVFRFAYVIRVKEPISIATSRRVQMRCLPPHRAIKISILRADGSAYPNNWACQVTLVPSSAAGVETCHLLFFAQRFTLSILFLRDRCW